MRAAGDKQLFGASKTLAKVRHPLNSIPCVSLFSVFCHVPVVRVITEELVLMVPGLVNFPVSVASEVQSCHSSMIYAMLVSIMRYNDIINANLHVFFLFAHVETRYV